MKVDVTKAIGDIGSKMEATMAKLQVELKSDMAKLSRENAKMCGELKSELKSAIVELKSEIGGLRELKSERGELHAKLDGLNDKIKSLGRDFKRMYGAVLLAYIMYRICTSN